MLWLSTSFLQIWRQTKHSQNHQLLFTSRAFESHFSANIHHWDTKLIASCSPHYFLSNPLNFIAWQSLLNKIIFVRVVPHASRVRSRRLQQLCKFLSAADCHLPHGMSRSFSESRDTVCCRYLREVTANQYEAARPRVPKMKQQEPKHRDLRHFTQQQQNNTCIVVLVYCAKNTLVVMLACFKSRFAYTQRSAKQQKLRSSHAPANGFEIRWVFVVEIKTWNDTIVLLSSSSIVLVYIYVNRSYHSSSNKLSLAGSRLRSEVDASQLIILLQFCCY